MSVQGSLKTKKGKAKGLGAKLAELVGAVALAALLALVIMAWGVQAYEIPSSSMEPTLLIGDQLLVTKSEYDLKLPLHMLRLPFGNLPPAGSDIILWRLSRPGRGEIVVFRDPEGGPIPLIKRIVALPGETVALRGRQVFINGRPLKEPWGRYTAPPGARRPDFGPRKVPPDHYFVLGDNRDYSHDSRFWNQGRGGFVPRRDIIGRAHIVYWSWMGRSWRVRWGRLLTLLR